MINPDAQLVYVAGPYSNGDVEPNVAEAKRVGHLIMQVGHAPFVPHLNHHFHAEYPADYEDWLAVDLVMLRRCDLVYRMPGHSPGADREIAEAKAQGIPIFYTEEELLARLAYLNDDSVELAP